MARPGFLLTRFALHAFFWTWLAATLTLACGGTIQGWQAIVGIASGLLACGSAANPNGSFALLGTLGCLALFATALALAVVLPALSWDANLYHFPAVLALAEGWNPIWDREAPCVLGLPEPVRCYPKAAWIFGASLHSLLPNVDVVKTLHWLLLAAPAGPAYVFLRGCCRCSRIWSLLGVVAVSLHPIALSQLTTGYVDGIVASLLSTMLFLSFHAVRANSGRTLVLVYLATTLLVGTKFTGLVYATSIALIVLAAGALRRRPVRRFAWVIAAALATGVLLSFDSYGWNSIRHGNPFQSVWQPGGANNIHYHASEPFRAHGRLEKLVRSLGSRQMPPEHEMRVDPVLRVPFTDLHWRSRYDSRYSGFGPLFWEALLLALLAFPIAFRRHNVWSHAAMAAVLGSVLATDAAWWARLAPQLWLLPILLVFGARVPRSRDHTHTFLTVARGGTLLLILVNSSIVGIKSMRHAVRVSDRWFAEVVDPSAPTSRHFPADELEATVARRIAAQRRNNGIVGSTVEGSRKEADPQSGSDTPGWLSRLRLGFGLGIRR